MVLLRTTRASKEVNEAPIERLACKVRATVGWCIIMRLDDVYYLYHEEYNGYTWLGVEAN